MVCQYGSNNDQNLMSGSKRIFLCFLFEDFFNKEMQEGAEQRL
jgi:hypothetical protein